MIKIFWSEEDKSFIAEDDTRPGCCADGPTEFKALSELVWAQRAWDEAKAELAKK